MLIIKMLHNFLEKDIMIDLFGKVLSSSGHSSRLKEIMPCDDFVAGQILFENGVICNGQWYFSADPTEDEDTCEVVGEKGTLRFGFFGESVLTRININGKIEGEEKYPHPEHIQQPMIQRIVEFFTNEHVPNPCSVEEAVTVMEIIDSFTAS